MNDQKPSSSRKYETGQQQPSIGRIVHYWILNSEECRETPNPAVITRVHSDGTVDLHVLGDLSNEAAAPHPELRFNRPESDDGRAGTWRWPPRV